MSNRISLLTTLSIALVLFLLGIYGLLMMHAGKFQENITEKINIIAELSDGVPPQHADAIMKELSNNEAIVSNSVQLIDKEKAQELMLGEMGDSFLSEDAENPFRDAILFNLHSEYYNNDYLSDLKAQLSARPQVVSVFYQEDFFQAIERNLKNISWIIFGVGILLLILAIALIYNTVYLSLARDEQKITTMDLVGATHPYIRRPYLSQAVKKGLLSSILAIVGIIILVLVVASRMGYGMGFLNIPYTVIVFLLVAIIGVAIPLITTRQVVTRYLKKVYIGNS